ncbi:hypothetical protein PS943_02821 [Pseudomonas fluorescens]|uniref:Uncharacterized protein n=1 Tax=Pseudomonas fluorescens TaxID=294 RepID=A0A5E7WC14_PSEFL|nr:hypothetical protein PS943_02821 [Pseudomonas fluorescens]
MNGRVAEPFSDSLNVQLMGGDSRTLAVLTQAVMMATM